MIHKNTRNFGQEEQCTSFLPFLDTPVAGVAAIYARDKFTCDTTSAGLLYGPRRRITLQQHWTPTRVKRRPGGGGRKEGSSFCFYYSYSPTARDSIVVVEVTMFILHRVSFREDVARLLCTLPA